MNQPNTSTLVDALLRHLRERGIRVVYDGEDKMHLAGETKGIDPKVMEALKKYRSYILERVKATLAPQESVPNQETDPNPTQAPARPEWETCLECRAMVHQSMTTEDALILCNRNGALASKGIPATNRCPYRPPISSGRGGE